MRPCSPLKTVVVLVIAGGAVGLAGRLHATGGKLTAQLIYGDANAVMDIPLEKDRNLQCGHRLLYSYIEVKDGRADAVADSFVTSLSPTRSVRWCACS